MALALYRKYRPRTFAEVIGQEHVTEPLSQALRAGRLHHAYLFSGPRGCGKTSSARILARSLNCEQGPTPDPCGECDSCRALAPDGSGSIDVIEIDAASHGGVDDARELRERAFFAPVSSRFKVYVIDEAHMVSSAGFNALLKLVEEPPEYVKFVFATTEPEKVLGTIKSRTHHYPFRLIPPGVLRPYLEQLCVREGAAVEPAVFPLVVRAGGGSARDSLSVLDQLIAGAGPEGVTYARAVALLGVTDVALIDEMCDALAAGDGAAAYATIDRVAEAGHDPRRFASDLLERLRDLIILQQVPDAATKGLLDCPQDVLDRMAAQASHLGSGTLSRFADIVHTGLTEMRGTTAPRLLLELICARMLLPGADDSTGALLQRLERMERRLELGAASVATHPAPAEPAGTARPDVPASPIAAAPERPVPQPTEPRPAAPRPEPPAAETEPAEPRAAEPPAAEPPAAEPRAVAAASVSGPPAADPTTPGAPGALDAVAVRRVWDEVLTIVGRKSKRAAAVVREATVRDVDGDTLVLVFRHSVHAEMLSGSPDLLVEALYELLGGRWRLRCELGGAAGGPSEARRDAAPPRRDPAPAQPRREPTSGAEPAQRADSAARESAPRESAPRESAPRPEPVQRAGSAPRTDPAPRGEPGHRADPGRRPEPSQRTAYSKSPQPAAASAPAGPAPAEDWPTMAVPGGGAIATASAPEQVTRAAPAPRGRPARGEPRRAAGGEPRRAAGGTGDSAWDGTAAEEPPFDPEYDSAPGFDPGDEPVDDAAGGTVVRESSEEQALRLLAEALGAEKIGDSDKR